MVVVVAVVMVAGAFGIGSPFRIERGADRVDVAAQAFDHGGDDVIVADTDRAAVLVRQELGWQVAVAEVPSDADEIGGGVGVDFVELFGFGFNQHTGSIGEAQHGAIAQVDRAPLVEEDAAAADGVEHHSAATPPVVIEAHAVSSAGGARWLDADHPLHDPILSAQ